MTYDMCHVFVEQPRLHRVFKIIQTKILEGGSIPVLDHKHLRATFLMTEGLLRLTGFADVKCQLKTRDPLCPAAVLSTGGLRTKSGDLG